MTVPWGGATIDEEAWCLRALQSVTDVDPMDPLADLTVVVPSRRRQSYLLRQICFWVHRSVQLIIVDGSEEPLGRAVRDALERQPRVSYVHDSRSMSDRLQRAGRMIDTPFAVMLGDDEFQLPSGLRESIMALRADPDLVGCMGQVVSFLPVGGFRRLTFYRAYRQMDGFEARQVEPVARVAAAFEEYTMATCYAVLTSATWRASWGSVLEYSSGHAAEIQQAMTVHLLGGFTTTNHLQMLRSIENPTDSVADAEAEGKIWFPEWWESPQFLDERDRFVGALVDVLTGRGAGSPDRLTCIEWVRDAAENFVAKNRSALELATAQLSPTNSGQQVFELVRAAVGRLPIGLNLVARKVRRASLKVFGCAAVDDYGSVSDLARSGRIDSIVFSEEVILDLQQIEKLVVEFHARRRGV